MTDHGTECPNVARETSLLRTVSQSVTVPPMHTARPAVIFACEPLTASLWDEAAPLLWDHFSEIATYRDIPLAPDFATYAASVEAGIIRVYTAREQSSSYYGQCPLVGYALWFVRPSPHYRGSVQAVSDVVFLDKDCRGFTGIKFLKYMDTMLAAEGVQVAYHHLKAAHDWSAILKRMGYSVQDLILAKRFDTAPIVRKTTHSVPELERELLAIIAQDA